MDDEIATVGLLLAWLGLPALAGGAGVALVGGACAGRCARAGARAASRRILVSSLVAGAAIALSPIVMFAVLFAVNELALVDRWYHPIRWEAAVTLGLVAAALPRLLGAFGIASAGGADV